MAQLGVGAQPIPRPKLKVADLAAALRAMQSPEMRRKTADLGAALRAESDGVAEAVRLIQNHLYKERFAMCQIKKTRAHWMVCLALVFVLSACTLTQPASPTPAPSIIPSSIPATVLPSVTPTAALPAHLIGVRIVDGKAEFYNLETNERFVPRGANYHDLGPEEGYVVDRLFSPLYYNSAQVSEDLSQMKAMGYNTVRTCLDICVENCIMTQDGEFSVAYLDNIADFLWQAHRHNLAVILTTNDLPKFSPYTRLVEAQYSEQFDGYMNTQHLHPKGVEAFQRYWQDVLRELKARQAPLGECFAQNELGVWGLENK